MWKANNTFIATVIVKYVQLIGPNTRAKPSHGPTIKVICMLEVLSIPNQMTAKLHEMKNIISKW